MICLQSAFTEGPCFVLLPWILEETGHLVLCLWMGRGLPLSSCPGWWVLRAQPLGWQAQSVPSCCLRVQSLGPLGFSCPWWPFRAPTRAGPVNAENISLGQRNCLPLFLKRVLVICRRNGVGGPGKLALNFVGDFIGLARLPGLPRKLNRVQEREGVVTVTQSRGGAFSSLRKRKATLSQLSLRS